MAFALATILFMCLTAAMQVSAQQAEPADAVTADITPLQIGDTIPEYLWHLPLQVVNHPEGKDAITLNDYRGNIVLLDFLSTGCRGCILALPKIETVVSANQNDVIALPITPEKRERVAKFIPQNNHIHDIKLPFVVGNTTLKEYFPHLYISHVVWIDQNGIVRATTGASHVTARTVGEFKQGKTLDWPTKTEYTPFFNAPLINLPSAINKPSKKVVRPVHYAVLTGHMEGVGPYVATREDSLQGISRISFRNKSMLDLYRTALGSDFAPSTIIDTELDGLYYSQKQADEDSVTKDEWQRKYELCYERIVPLGTPRQVWQSLMLKDLNEFLGFDGRIEKRDGKHFFVLSKF